MLVAEFNYHLPPELIAQEPLERREESRMLVVDRQTGKLSDGRFVDFPSLLRPGDVLTLNNTQVFPARLIGQREKTGGRAELFLIRCYDGKIYSETNETEGEVWEVLAKPGRSLRVGARANFGPGLAAEVLVQLPAGRRVVRFEFEGDFAAILDQVGATPLPPYIKRDEEQVRLDRDRYQTVYARERGAIAAPTAGLHFTPEILSRIAQRGVELVELTHHVGYGTFQPVRVARVEDHRVEAERYTLSTEMAGRLNRAKQDGRRIIAVGTTTTRALESAIDEAGRFRPGAAVTELFIYPGYEFRAIDCLLTNFHLPESSLLMLVSALAGHQVTMAAYEHAVEARYRFYSYGDCMFIQ